MLANCPRCGASNPDVACFCRNCGRPLEGVGEGKLNAGRTPHGDPLPPPAGFVPIEYAMELYYRWEAASGGAPLLGTETLSVEVFNGGYDLTQVALVVRGMDQAGNMRLGLVHELEDWPRGRTVQFEIPSYELPDPIHKVKVELVRAEFH
jgi:hypothetical protein